MTTNERKLNEIRARLAAATPGPWEAVTVTKYPHLRNVVAYLPTGRHIAIAGMCDAGSNTDLITHSYADIEWLLAEVDRLSELISKNS